MVEQISSLPQVEMAGLSDEQVARALESGQVNRTARTTSRSIVDIIRANVFTLFNGIIFAAMLVVLATGSFNDAVFGFVIVINTGIGILTELKAKATLDRLSILVASSAIVRRNGHNISIDCQDIVLGDLLWVRSGDQVPADVRVSKAWGLEMDESMLTGESATVAKHQGDMVYSGSTAVSGMALTVVQAVGAQSYAAKLSAQAKAYKKTVSDLSRGINTILRWMTLVVVPLCVLLVWSQIHKVGGWNVAITTGAWRNAIVAAVAGVVGMIPEGLVLLTSLNFALAAMRLARKQTLVQELESVETLARVDCLNLDKTGTITDGTIAFKDYVPLDDDLASNRVEEAQRALYALANEENPNATGKAMMQALRAKGVVSTATTVVARIPFSSSRKWSAVVLQDAEGQTQCWYMGAPEVLSRLITVDCTSVLQQVQSYANMGERVLMIAQAPIAPEHVEEFEASKQVIASVRPAGLVRLSECIRSDARATLKWFREQGVRCRVISGDNPQTVASVARSVALTGDRELVAMDAHDLPEDIDELADVLENVDVLGRVLPEQKKAIVQALHRNGHVVAMTGDGVNDTLALKEADLGIAMGNAAGAAKAVAQVVLVDSRFSHLPDVVARGRQVMANMERVAGLFLVKTVYSALISFGVVVLGLHFPYLPRHITYIGALTIGIPAFLLALAPNTRRYLPGFLRRVVQFALPSGIGIGVSVLITSLVVPRALRWSIDTNPDELLTLRVICAMIVFALSVIVLARVAKPLCSWRGVMVVLFALAGIVGLLIPFTSRFFMLALPSGAVLVALLVVVAVSLVLYALIAVIAKLLDRMGYFARR